jgi:hypothetical protein
MDVVVGHETGHETCGHGHRLANIGIGLSRLMKLIQLIEHQPIPTYLTYQPVNLSATMVSGLSTIAHARTYVRTHVRTHALGLDNMDGLDL